MTTQDSDTRCQTCYWMNSVAHPEWLWCRMFVDRQRECLQWKPMEGGEDGP